MYEICQTREDPLKVQNTKKICFGKLITWTKLFTNLKLFTTFSENVFCQFQKTFYKCDKLFTIAENFLQEKGETL